MENIVEHFNGEDERKTTENYLNFSLQFDVGKVLPIGNRMPS